MRKKLKEEGANAYFHKDSMDLKRDLIAQNIPSMLTEIEERIGT
jgi:hypothetical protein